MDKLEELKETLSTDRDFVCLPRYGCSLKRVLDRYPDGVPDVMGAEALHLSVNAYNDLVAGAMEELRSHL